MCLARDALHGPGKIVGGFDAIEESLLAGLMV
jgi:hypothetical protein